MSLRENELENIEAELKMLSNAEGIKTTLNRVCGELAEGEQPITQQLKSLSNLLNSYTGFHKDLPEINSRLQSAQIELSDIAAELERLNDHINYDAEKIEELNERMSAGYKLQKKHGVQSTNELLAIQQQLEEKLDAVLNIAENIASWKHRLPTTTKSTAAGRKDIAGPQKAAACLREKRESVIGAGRYA